jgi:hypothetical protein
VARLTGLSARSCLLSLATGAVVLIVTAAAGPTPLDRTTAEETRIEARTGSSA